MKRSILYLFILILTLIPASAKASHEEFLAFIQSDSGIDMYTYYKWQNYSIYYPGTTYNTYRYLRWKADNVATEQIVSSALIEWITIDNLNGTNDYHPWLNVTTDTQQTPDIRMYGASCPIPGGALGCVMYDTWNYDLTRETWRWATARVYVNPTPSFPYATTQAHKAVWLHELGHVYGRGEGYAHNPTDCGPSNTIMDAMFSDGTYLYHCDGISAPTANDKASHQTYFTLGYVSQVNVLQQSGNTVIFAYQDFAWEEWGTFVEYQKLESGVWVTKGNTTLTEDVGTRNNIQSRIINYSHPVKTLWGTGTYRVKARPWFGTKNNGTPVYGTLLTTGSVVVN